MTLSSAYTLLDAFVIPKSYVVVAQAQTENSTVEFDAAEIQETADLIVLNSVELDKAEIQENVDLTELNIVELDEPEIQGNADLMESNPIDEVDPIAANTLASEVQTEVIITDHAYMDAHININIEMIEENGVVFYVADIQLSDVSYLKTAFAYDTFGRNITQPTSEMAAANNAIFAINGDYYGFRDTGLIIRNGVLYRDVPENSVSDQSLTIDGEGNFEIVDNNQASGTLLVEAGILQSFSFGPTLVLDGQVMATNDTAVSQDENPRTAVGQISPLHYLFIVVDGRSNTSDGMTLPQLAQAFVDRGAEVAYNLDGGGSSAMWLNGNLINNPTSGRRDGERDISDIIYIGY
jgi:exopolysaccharide biosynthesis protein